jgi:thiamine kinase-like enzyme
LKSIERIPDDGPGADANRRLYKIFLDTCKNLNTCDTIISKMKLWDLSKIFNSWYIVPEPMKCGFYVLNHGDNWINNLLFKLDSEGSAEDVKLIDYQFSYFGSPAGDLFYFLITSLADDVKAKHFDELIEYYHGELVSDLRKLNYSESIPTLDEIYQDLLEKRAFGNKIVSNG